LASPRKDPFLFFSTDTPSCFLPRNLSVFFGKLHPKIFSHPAHEHPPPSLSLFVFVRVSSPFIFPQDLLESHKQPLFPPILVVMLALMSLVERISPSSPQLFCGPFMRDPRLPFVFAGFPAAFPPIASIFSFFSAS